MTVQCCLEACATAARCGATASRLKELEAESVAFVVCHAIGIASDDWSFGYVAGWNCGGAEAIAAIKTGGLSCSKLAMMDILPSGAHLVLAVRQTETGPILVPYFDPSPPSFAANVLAAGNVRQVRVNRLDSEAENGAYYGRVVIGGPAGQCCQRLAPGRPQDAERSHPRSRATPHRNQAASRISTTPITAHCTCPVITDPLMRLKP